VVSRGIAASLIGQVLIEESVAGWEELELEVVRDSKNHMITVCFIENVDAMGVHTGDSFCTAPMLTISQELQDKLQDYSYRIVEAIKVIGGTNIQFAHDPKTGRVVVIEINPRTSRSSALASKATGFPIALISAKLAAGLNLDDIPYWKEGTLEKYAPSGDYVVVKFPRWAFEKFRGSKDVLGTQMKAVGEAMSIGKSYKEAFQKAIRSLENSRYGLGFARDYNSRSPEELMMLLKETSSERQFILYEAIRKGADIQKLYQLTHIKPWFLQQMKELVQLEEEILAYKGKPLVDLPDELLSQAKKDGFADRYLSKLLAVPEAEIRARRKSLGIVQGWEPVPVSGVENAFYYYSTYNAPDRTPSSSRRKVMVLGGGPNRIGQGIEFDYCCVHAAFALRDMGIETIMVNCNPETVSTDYDTSDKLYFEPLTAEDVLSIYQKESPVGVIVQFGGQTPLNLAGELEKNGVKVLGTPPSAIDLAEDRDLFRAMMEKLMIPMPESGMAVTVEEAIETAKRIGYPVMVRPSYVLGGRGMEVVYSDEIMVKYMEAAVGVTPDRPILIDRFLRHATECEADAICDGSLAYVPAVMEHIELAGIHSGDSACIIPSKNISEANLKTIRYYTKKIAEELHVVGLMNIQYAIENEIVYALEANPRASRTVPLVSKVCNVQMVPIAVERMCASLTGISPPIGKPEEKHIPYYGVKEAVFPFNMFPEVDPVLGPEMRSTGEVLGLADNFGEAFLKAEEATQFPLPRSGNIFFRFDTLDKEDALVVAKKLSGAGFGLYSTGPSVTILQELGCQEIKEDEQSVSILFQENSIRLIIDTMQAETRFDSLVRKEAIRTQTPYITTMAAAMATAEGLWVCKESTRQPVHSLQELHRRII
ncbi:MAG TPA: carbamoyl phosphate synthase large subunit, partial [Clostridiales bacterium]|nr:carbamoyl phosphate synthase large subunit [Clostridiales bacterium]